MFFFFFIRNYQVEGVWGNDPLILESGVDIEVYNSLLLGEIVKLDSTSKIIKINNFEELDQI